MYNENKCWSCGTDYSDKEKICPNCKRSKNEIKLEFNNWTTDSSVGMADYNQPIPIEPSELAKHIVQYAEDHIDNIKIIDVKNTDVSVANSILIEFSHLDRQKSVPNSSILDIKISKVKLQEGWWKTTLIYRQKAINNQQFIDIKLDSDEYDYIHKNFIELFDKWRTKIRDDSKRFAHFKDSIDPVSRNSKKYNL